MNINPALTIEDFGSEIIIVNLRNGAYFTLKGSATEVWRDMVAAENMSGFLIAFSAKFTLDTDAISHLHQLANEFSNDGLAEISTTDLALILDFPPVQKNGKPSFEMPVYEKFTNMQDILLLDPIHDVSEMGWPHTKG